MNEAKVCIIDYGSGNVQSVYNMISLLAKETVISNEDKDLEKATHVILPGVGAFGAAMEKIKALGIVDGLKSIVLRQKKPFLGICVGMQVLADRGFEHGEFTGLGFIPGEVKLLKTGDLRLPHIGWNNLVGIKKHPLLEGMSEETDFYYVNSYHFAAGSHENVLGQCVYGETFASIVGRDNIFGVQFHPEKSQKAGQRLLTNFLKLI